MTQWLALKAIPKELQIVFLQADAFRLEAVIILVGSLTSYLAQLFFGLAYHDLGLFQHLYMTFDFL